MARIIGQRPGTDQPLVGPLHQPFLVAAIQNVHLDSQFTADPVQHHGQNPMTMLGSGVYQARMAVLPDRLVLGKLLETLIFDGEEAGLFQVGLGEAPAPFQVTVEAIGENLPQNLVGIQGSSSP